MVSVKRHPNRTSYGFSRCDWRNAPQDVIDRSISPSEFGPWENWHISKHDVGNLAERIEEQAIDANADDPENEIDPDAEAQLELPETEQ